jgi:hypothetical protein
MFFSLFSSTGEERASGSYLFLRRQLCALLRGRLHGAFSMCVFMSGEPFDAEACDIGGQASATNGSPDMKTHIENAACNRPLKQSIQIPRQIDQLEFISPLAFTRPSNLPWLPAACNWLAHKFHNPCYYEWSASEILHFGIQHDAAMQPGKKLALR